jgi:hypothetical protein
MTLHTMIIALQSSQQYSFLQNYNNCIFLRKKRLSFRALTQKQSETMNIINPAQNPEDARLLARMVKDVN